MLQTILNLLPVFIIGTTIYITLCISISLKNARTGMMQSLCWLLERTPALDTFLLFIIQTVYIITAVFCAFSNLSNHAVISLDIIYFFSMMMLIFYHIIKESRNPTYES